MNNASMNTYAQVFVWTDISFHFLLGIYQGVELLAYVVNLCLTLKETAKLFFEVAVPFPFLPADYESPSCLISSPTLASLSF